MLKALDKSLGVVTTACKMAGVGRTTFYEWLDKDLEFKKAVEEFKETHFVTDADIAAMQKIELLKDSQILKMYL